MLHCRRRGTHRVGQLKHCFRVGSASHESADVWRRRGQTSLDLLDLNHVTHDGLPVHKGPFPGHHRL
ncbi:hypothetical protein THIOKS13020035 [Thiocapsa sp. KS1]|nr:hypothetical protein THIOKS13020035 [Thiocapsa sp. KS1]